MTAGRLPFIVKGSGKSQGKETPGWPGPDRRFIVIVLERIELEGFRSIREMDLELSDLNILIGANGSGKSNFASIFALVNQIAMKNLQVYVGRSGGADALLHFGRKTTERIYCHLHFVRGGYFFALAPTASDRMIFTEEECYYPSPREAEPVRRRWPKGDKESRLDEDAHLPVLRMGANLFKLLQPWRVYHFHDTSESAKVRQTCELHDNKALRADASNLASFLYLLREKHQEHYRNIVDAVRMVAPFFDDFDLSPSRLNEKKIRLEWREKGTDAYFGPEALSDGTVRFICLATLLLQPQLPSLIVIDEPELGLHPSAIALAASLLKSASTKTQVIACTQSVTLVNQFEPADIVVVDREEGQSVFRRLSEEDVKDWLEDYGLGDLWEKNVLGGRP